MYLCLTAHCNDCPQWLTSLYSLCTKNDLCSESDIANSVLAIDVYSHCLETCMQLMMCGCMHKDGGAIVERSNFILAFNKKTGVYKVCVHIIVM